MGGRRPRPGVGERALKTAFGLDIAGYAGGNSGFARADLGSEGGIRVTVYEDHVFGRRLAGADPLGTVAEAEQRTLRSCRMRGDVVVDTPVDLQGLPSPADTYFTWELVRRPVDYAFGALAPLADRIGAPVARFRNMLSALEGDDGKASHGVLETYPAASLKLLGWWATGYGSQPARFAGDRWDGGHLAFILNRLGVKAEDGETLDGDEFDAALCAITGVVDEGGLLRGRGLSELVSEKIRSRLSPRHHARIPTNVPENYVLMGRPPETEIRLVKRPLSGPDDAL